MTDQQKVREAFEAYVTRVHECCPDDLKWDESRNCYAMWAMHFAYQAWQAALAHASSATVKENLTVGEGEAVAWLEVEPGVSLEQAAGQYGMLIHSMRVHVGRKRPTKAQEANGLFPLYTHLSAQAKVRVKNAGLPRELRLVCGHDSRSVDGCLHCEAADAIEARDVGPTGKKATVSDAELLEAAREVGLRAYLHGVGPTDAEAILRRFVDKVATRLSQGAPETIRELMRNQKTPSAEDRALIANNMEFLVSQGAQGEAAGWIIEWDTEEGRMRVAELRKTKPDLSCFPANATAAPFYTHPAERAAVPAGLRRFVAMIEAKPLRGSDPDVIYAIHTGTEYAAEIRLSDLKAITAAPQPPEGARVVDGETSTPSHRCPTCDGPCDMFEEEGTFEIAYIYRSKANG